MQIQKKEIANDNVRLIGITACWIFCLGTGVFYIRISGMFAFPKSTLFPFLLIPSLGMGRDFDFIGVF